MRKFIITEPAWEAIQCGQLSPKATVMLFNAVTDYVYRGGDALISLPRNLRPMAGLLCHISDLASGRDSAELVEILKRCPEKERRKSGAAPEAEVAVAAAGLGAEDRTSEARGEEAATVEAAPAAAAAEIRETETEDHTLEMAGEEAAAVEAAPGEMQQAAGTARRDAGSKNSAPEADAASQKTRPASGSEAAASPVLAESRSGEQEASGETDDLEKAAEAGTSGDAVAETRPGRKAADGGASQAVEEGAKTCQEERRSARVPAGTSAHSAERLHARREEGLSEGERTA